ncbi:unnamed protein product [Linum tenue]|uniref:Uncharacterized protein n=1 Tax=Linum tenue TaxID=586396 RepID=A0AAV0R8L3_9ROSI|nr:unnamed protein product [Linum tenue]
MSIRAAAGIKSSSGNRAKSMKHCFTLGCLSNASKLFSRQLYSSPPSITGPASDNAMALVLHTSMGSPHSDLPTTEIFQVVVSIFFTLKHRISMTLEHVHSLDNTLHCLFFRHSDKEDVILESFCIESSSSSGSD